MNEELAKFTTDELLEELKRRLTGTGLKVQNVGVTPKYEYATGVVLSSSGDRYRIRLDEGYGHSHSEGFGIRPLTDAFNSKNRPMVGDRVKLKCRITKGCPKFSLFFARITEVIERSCD